jgi:molecular chaperone HscB
VGEEVVFCGCGAIQPPGGVVDHFATLGAARRYDLDAAELERRYKELTRKLHPDRFAKADPRARRYSLERATRVNDAYKVLRDPVRRAEYLLKLGGIDVADEQKGAEGVDPAFLMEMMEQREALADARADGQVARLTALASAMRERRDAAMVAVGGGFAAGKLAEVARELVALRYYDRFLAEIDSAEEKVSHA